MSTSVPLKLAAWTIALGLVALPVVGVTNGWFASDRWPFRQLKIDAEFERVSAEQIRASIASQLDVGFFAVDLASVQRSLEQLPWVQHVEVRKRWPDLIEVRLVERDAAAVWGDARLVSVEGELFDVPGEGVPEGLPRLVGPDTRVADVLAFYRAARDAFTETALSVTSVQLSGRGSWSLDLSSGAHVVIGREAPEQRLGRFLETMPRLEATPGAIWTHADLRYANGFALLWTAVLPEPATDPAIEGASPDAPVEQAPNDAAPAAERSPA